MPVKIRSAPSASDLSVVLISCQPCRRGPAISSRDLTRSRILQGWLKKHVQKSRCESRMDCASGPKPTAATPAASVKATRSGGTAMHTSCPRRTSSLPTARLGSTSPRLPQLASTNFIADLWPFSSCPHAADEEPEAPEPTTYQRVEQVCDNPSI